MSLELLDKIINHGEWGLDSITARLTPDEVDFCEALAASLPSLLDLLESPAEDTRQKSFGLIEKFANRREWKLDSIAARPTGMKSSFVEPP